MVKLVEQLTDEKESEKLHAISEQLEVFEQKWGPKSRGFLANAGALMSVLWEKRKEIMETLPHLMEVMRESGLHGIAVLLEPVIQDIMNDVKNANLKEGIEMASQKIESYLQAISMLRTVADNQSLGQLSRALDGLAKAGEYLTGTPRSTTERLAQEMLASQLLTTILKAESLGPINYLRKVVEGVCPHI